MSIEASISPEAFEAVLTHYDCNQPLDLYKIVCPFHADINASLQINKNKQFFHCYGCGKSGSAVEFVMANEPELNSIKAAKKVVDICKSNSVSVHVSNTSNSTKKIDSSVKTLTYSEGLEIGKNYYYTLPDVNWYKPDGVQEVIEARLYMNKRGFTNRLLNMAGAKVTYNNLYPIVFPMEANGIFRGYVLRTFDPTVEAKRKYMYNRGFKRERTLAGDFKSDTVLIVEGYLDKLKANQIGIKNVVAILGWKITSTQIKLLKKKGVKKIICGLDNDESGWKGYRYLKRINQFSVERLHYPKGCKDMGDVNSETADRILKQMKKYGGN